MTLQRRLGGDRAWTKGSNIRYAGTICSRDVYRAFPAVYTEHFAVNPNSRITSFGRCVFFDFWGWNLRTKQDLPRTDAYSMLKRACHTSLFPEKIKKCLFVFYFIAWLSHVSWKKLNCTHPSVLMLNLGHNFGHVPLLVLVCPERVPKDICPSLFTKGTKDTSEGALNTRDPSLHKTYMLEVYIAVHCNFYPRLSFRLW